LDRKHKEKPDYNEPGFSEKRHMRSDEKYRLLIDNIHDGIFIIQDAKMQFANKAFAGMTGFAVEEIIGKDFREFVAPEDLEMVADRYRRRQAGEDVPQEYEFSMLRKDGKTRVLVDMKVAIITYRGRVASMGTVMDITERKRVELALQASEKKYSTIVEKGNDGIVIIQDGKLKFANQMMAKITGLALHESIGKPYTDFISPQYRKLAVEKYEGRLAGKEFSNKYEIELISKNGNNIPVEINASLIEYVSKPAVMAIIRDITQRKRMDESLKLFMVALEEAPDGVQIVDLDGYITYSNRAVEEMFGISQEELNGKHVNEMNVDPEFAGGVILPSIKETGLWVGELMVKHKDGHSFPIWLNTSMVRDREGKPIAMVGIIRDMTERRRFENVLKQSEEQYRSLFENSPVSLWEEDSSLVKKYIDGLRNKGVEDFRTFFESHPEEVERVAKMVRIINVNKATLSMFKARSKEELLTGLDKIFSEHSYDIFREELVAISQGKTEFEGEDIVRTMTGDVLQIYMKWSVSPGHEQTYSRRHVSIVDVTERKQIEEAIKKYSRKLEDSNRMKELFIDIMHHDLMNPLATASGFIDLLKKEDPYNLAYIKIIEKNLLKAIDLIDCATKFSRIDSLENIDFMDMDLKEVIDGVIENLRPMSERAGIEIENMIMESMPVKANHIIEEIFSNLISNAIKYAANGKKIIVKGEDRDPFWNVMIIDFGEGLKKTDKSIIFDRFCRLEKKGVKGSGLGLAIVKKIVELHRGSIGVEDNPQGGAVFIVEIPKSEYLDQVH
jgi:PAS domain S-box-containing protein